MCAFKLNQETAYTMFKVLFLSSHVGLGHVVRDYAVAKVLRRLLPNSDIEWCSAEPAYSFLKAVGENVAEECGRLRSFSKVIEDLYNGGIRGLRELASRLDVLRENYGVIKEFLESGEYDLVFADEFWEVVYTAPKHVKQNVVFATDILYKPYSINPLDSLLSLILNHYFKHVLPEFRKLILLNDIEFFRGKRWYFIFGGTVEKWIKENMVVAGLTTSFLPEETPSRIEARRKLGLEDEEFVIVVSVGGTSARSRILLECIDNVSTALFRKLKKLTGAPKTRIIVLPGPRTVWKPKNPVLDVREGLIPRLLNYYAAADLFIIRAGRTTTADILCLGKPAILIPIKNHFEQEEIAKDLNKRFNYPVLRENECTLENLLYAVNWALKLNYRPPENLCRGTIITANILASSAREP